MALSRPPRRDAATPPPLPAWLFAGRDLSRARRPCLFAGRDAPVYSLGATPLSICWARRPCLFAGRDAPVYSLGATPLSIRWARRCGGARGLSPGPGLWRSGSESLSPQRREKRRAAGARRGSAGASVDTRTRESARVPAVCLGRLACAGSPPPNPQCHLVHVQMGDLSGARPAGVCGARPR